MGGKLKRNKSANSRKCMNSSDSGNGTAPAPAPAPTKLKFRRARKILQGKEREQHPHPHPQTDEIEILDKDDDATTETSFVVKVQNNDIYNGEVTSLDVDPKGEDDNDEDDGLSECGTCSQDQVPFPSFNEFGRYELFNASPSVDFKEDNEQISTRQKEDCEESSGIDKNVSRCLVTCMELKRKREDHLRKADETGSDHNKGPITIRKVVESNTKSGKDDIIEILDDDGDDEDEGKSTDFASKPEAKRSRNKPKSKVARKLKDRTNNDKNNVSLLSISSPEAEAEAEAEADFAISNSKRIADLKAKFALKNPTCNKGSRKDASEKRFNTLLKLAQTDAEIERVLVSRVELCEKSVAWHENKRLEAVRALKKHRNVLIKKEAENIRRRKSKYHQFLDIDDERCGPELATSSVNAAKRAQNARRSLFAFAPDFQPTLTQMAVIGKEFESSAPPNIIQVEKLIDIDENEDEIKSDSERECNAHNDGDKQDRCGEHGDLRSHETESDSSWESPEYERRSRLWKATKAPIAIEEIISKTMFNMEHDGLSHLLHLMDEPAPSIEKNETSDSEFLCSQLSQEGLQGVEDIERAICENPSKLSAIQSACPNWKEHILYAHRRNDADGVHEALQNVRGSILNLQMIKEKFQSTWSKQQCALELYEMALSRALNRLTKKSSILVDIKANDFKDNNNLPLIEIAEESNQDVASSTSSDGSGSIKEVHIKLNSWVDDENSQNSDQRSNDNDDSLLDFCPFVPKDNELSKVDGKEKYENAECSTSNESDPTSVPEKATQNASLACSPRIITKILKESHLWKSFLRRESVPFEIIQTVLEQSSIKVSKKGLVDYLNKQGIPYATAWRKKKNTD